MSGNVSTDGFYHINEKILVRHPDPLKGRKQTVVTNVQIVYWLDEELPNTIKIAKGFDLEDDMDENADIEGDYGFYVSYENPHQRFVFNKSYLEWARENNIDLVTYPMLYFLVNSENMNDRKMGYKFVKDHGSILKTKNQWVFIDQISKYSPPRKLNRTEGGKKKKNTKTKKNQKRM